jgi:uncharacterized protein (TIGR02246 family)
MKQLHLILPLVLVLCFVCGCDLRKERAEKPAVDVAADKGAIKDLLEIQYASIIAEGDFERWLTFFTEDVIFMPPNSATLYGIDATREFVQPIFEMFNFETDITVDEVEVSDDWAFARWHYMAQYKPKTEGDTIPENGKEIWIFKRQLDGSWRCSHIIWNSNDPLPTSQ